jgi:hypothetical protein
MRIDPVLAFRPVFGFVFRFVDHEDREIVVSRSPVSARNGKRAINGPLLPLN